MPTGDDKRFCRELKRKLKKTGKKRRRKAEKRSLAVSPDEAHLAEHGYGRDSTEWLNGLAEDRTRKRHKE